MRYRSGQSSGFTLIELLIVLLIIGALSGVTLRAIEMTRERTMYSDTTKKMFDLVKAIAGNPDLLADGKRVDFGFIGDMGRLPLTLSELMRNSENNSNWHGPYLKISMLEDTLNPGYRTDAWGNEIQYDYNTGTLHSRGNGRQMLTYNITDSLSFLFNNKISGTITDNYNNPPGPRLDSFIDVFIQLPEGTVHDTVSASGAYQIENVPIGKHPLWVIRQTATIETLFKYVSVVPKSNTIVDFKFSKAFQSMLKYRTGTAIAYLPPGTPGSLLESAKFDVYNDGGETLKIGSMFFVRITPPPPETAAYCDSVFVTDQTTRNTYYLFGYPPASQRLGERNGFSFPQPLNISPSTTLTFFLHHFFNGPVIDSSIISVNMDSSDFQINFDGSIINFLARRELTP